MNIFRKLYDWVLSWADSPYGGLALFLVAFMEASFFPIPPDPLLIALVLGAGSKAFKYAANCTIASVLGAVFGYFIGYFIWWSGDGQFSSVANWFFEHIPGFTQDTFANVQNWYEKWSFWAIFTAGFTPIPFKLFTIAAGACDVNLFMVILGSVVSRGARFFLIAWLIWKFGPQIKNFIDKYFNWLAIGFTVLLIGGFYLIAKVL